MVFETVEISAPIEESSDEGHGQRLQRVRLLLPLSLSSCLRSVLAWASRLYPRGVILAYRPAHSKLAPVSI